MKDIYIIGVGGFAKEVFFLIKEINKEKEIYNFKGFIDKKNDLKKIQIGNQEFDIIEEDNFLESSKKDSTEINLAFGLGDPVLISKLSMKFKDFLFPNLIHPTFVGDLNTIRLGKGNIITSNCVFTLDIRIGNFNIFNLNVTLGHDAIIGNCNVINPGVNISGGVEIMNNNLIGTGAVILQYLKIGSNSILGASSLLTKNLPDNKLAIGLPAKTIKDL